MPDSLVHAVLGQLRWQPQYSWWFGEARFPSGVVADLVIAADDTGTAFVDTAALLYQRVVQAEARIRREAAATGILDLYRRWRNDDDPELTAEELARRLEPTFLRIDTSLHPVTLSYALGERNEVFGGHAIDVNVSDQLEVTDVNLVG